MALSRREERFLKAFESCIEHGEYTADYAVTLLEDDRRYGWMSAEAKEAFYDWLDAWEREQEEKALAEAARAAENARILAGTPEAEEEEEDLFGEDPEDSGEPEPNPEDSAEPESEGDEAGEVTEDETAKEPENN